MKRVLALATLLAGMLLVLWALFGGDNDEEKIRAQLERLATAVEVEGGDQNPVFRVAHLNQEFAELFTANVTVRIPELSSLRSGRQALAGLAGRATTYVETLDIELSDIGVQLDGSGSARVTARATLDAMRPGGRRELDARELSLRFVEHDGDWLIDSLRAEPKDSEREQPTE